MKIILEFDSFSQKMKKKKKDKETPLQSCYKFIKQQIILSDY